MYTWKIVFRKGLKEIEYYSFVFIQYISPFEGFLIGLGSQVVVFLTIWRLPIIPSLTSVNKISVNV